MSSMITNMQGKTIRIRTVALIKPKEMLTAMGIRNLAWKDVVLVPKGATIDLLVDFTNPGDWLMHCHMLEHAEAGMKSIVTVLPA